MPILSTVRLILGVSQLYWAWRIYLFLAGRIRSRAWLIAACASIAAIYFAGYQYNLGAWRGHSTPVHLTLSEALLGAPFLCWAASSFFAFLVVLLFAIPRGIAQGIAWLIPPRKDPAPDLASPARRDLLQNAVTLAAGAPFIAGAYGLFYGRLNLEITQQPVHLPRLPRAFRGFRIVQISDIHIGPFMPASEIRKYVAIANQQKTDLIVLTGDYVTFDPDTQLSVVDALRGLRAPYGVYGSLGNHDAWAGVEDSITDLFRRVGIRILRGESVSLASHGESINLIGVDFESAHRFGPSPAVKNLLGDIEGLVDPHRVNILLSHNPDTFPRAAQLGIDFSLAGHTHGGQAALEFISPEIAPSRLLTPYVAGWFERPGAQLYVNRGIGTIFIPIRIGAPPELTVYTLLA